MFCRSVPSLSNNSTLLMIWEPTLMIMMSYAPMWVRQPKPPRPSKGSYSIWLNMRTRMKWWLSATWTKTRRRSSLVLRQKIPSKYPLVCRVNYKLIMWWAWTQLTPSTAPNSMIHSPSIPPKPAEGRKWNCTANLWLKHKSEDSRHPKQ